MPARRSIGPIEGLDGDLQTLIRERAQQVMRRRQQVRSIGSADSIHDVRVATRRLQEALDVFAGLLPDRERKRLRRRARRIRKCLAEIRDADVLVDLVRRWRARSERANGAAPSRGAKFGGARSGGARSVGARTGRTLAAAPPDQGLAGIERHLLERALWLRFSLKRRGGKGRAALEGLRVPGLLRRSYALLVAAGPVPAEKLRVAARAAIAARGRGVRAAQRRAASLRAWPLHQLRIAIKRYRYSLEILEACGAPPPKQAVEQARLLQEGLGNVHDLDVLIALVRRARADGPFLRALRRERRARARDVREMMRTFRPLAARSADGVPALRARPARAAGMKARMA